MILVKLGGSVITDKARLRTFRKVQCGRLARELMPVKGSLALVHGAGSFGHIEAKKHSLHKGYKSRAQLEHVAGVQRDVRELNLKVLESLIDAGIGAVSIPPAAAATYDKGQVSTFDGRPFEWVLGLGLTPITFGDVVPDSSLGFSISSGDLMMEELAKRFRPEIVVFCADVDGVYDRDPKSHKSASLIPELDRPGVSNLIRTRAGTADVTGSIFGKLERMLAIARYCEKCMIVNGNVPGRLKSAVRGRKVVSTVVLPG